MSQRTKDPALSDRAYRAILTMIVEGEIPIGGKLPTEHVLCERLKLSRPVLRQALKQLRDDDVIVSRQGSGSYLRRLPQSIDLDLVRVGSLKDIERTFEFRVAIEADAAFWAARRRTAEDIATLTTILVQLDACLSVGRSGVEKDEAFHTAICTAADNPFFSSARGSMQANIIVGLKLNQTRAVADVQDRMKRAQVEHYEILKAIEEGDADAARIAMRTHIENAKARVLSKD